MKRRSLLRWASYCGAMACATGSGLISSPLAQTREAATQLTMQLDWLFNVQFAGLFVADHDGLYRANGVDVVIKSLQPGLMVTSVVADQPLMIGCTEQSLILEAQAKGVPLRAIATMFQASPYALMALPNSGIRTLQDLVGKTIGVHRDGVKVVELVKGVNGLSPDAIKMVEIDYPGKIDRLIKGEFAAIPCYAVDEPIRFERQVGTPPVVIPMDRYGYNAYAQVFFTTTTVLAQQPDLVRAFLQASFEGWRRALADIPGTARLVVERYAPLNSEFQDLDYQTRSLQLVAEYVLRGIAPAQLGRISPDRWQQTTDLMAQYGIINAVPNPTTSLNLNFW